MTQPTSLDAYQRIQPTLGRRHNEVMNVFRANPGRDFTNAELSRRLGWSINRVTPRVYELRKMGLLRWCRTRQCSVTGSTAMAWTEADAEKWRNL